MARDPERQGGFPWWVVSVMAAGLVLVILVASRPAPQDRVSVRSRRTASARIDSAQTSVPPTTARTPKRAVAAARRSVPSAPTTVATFATTPPTTAASAPRVELPKTG
jgi:hypothetical protein